MKLIALAAALALSGPALAQTSAPTPPAAPDAQAAAPIGGYQPDHPALSAQPQPGQQVIFQASTLTPDQAYPPPKPLDHYPVCKRGQTDQCMQRGGR